MSPSELTLGKEARKLMDLTIPMGCNKHSNEAVKMIKGLEGKKRPNQKALGEGSKAL
jgi:hypothetical protein